MKNPPLNAAFKALFQRHSLALQAYAAKRVGHQDAEDVMQEAYVRLLAQPDLQAIRYPQAFLFKTVANVTVDMHRRQKTYTTHCVDTDIDLDNLPGQSLDASDYAEGSNQPARFQAALAELPSECRDVFLLHRLDGLKQLEIAALFGITVRTVERHVAKAFTHLHARLHD